MPIIRRSARKLTSILLLLPLLASPGRAAEPGIEAIVLCYHVVQSPTDTIYSIDRASFQEQMNYLAMTGYNVIPLSELAEYVAGKRETLPPNPVVITVDDGWRCTYTEIYPEMQRLGFPFTVFVYPKFIQRGTNPYALSWDEVREMSDAGVDIQSHTYSHSFLTHRKHSELSGTDYTQFLQDELKKSKQTIEKQTGKPVRYLAYPYGDYDTRVARTVEKAGYDAALTCDYGPVKRGTDLFRMRRISMYKDTSFATFREHLRGGGLRLADQTPRRQFDPESPVIEATIKNYEQLDPDSVRITLLSLGQTPYSYNPDNGTISMVVREPLEKSEQRVVIWGREKETGRRLEATWSFRVGAADEVVATAKPATPQPPAARAPATVTTAGGSRRR